MSLDAMKQALEALEAALSDDQPYIERCKQTITALRAAIEQAEKPRQWQGLTEEEVSDILDREIGFNSCFGPETDFARAIEAKLKEKNT